MILHAFHWKENTVKPEPKPEYPQLSYYHRKMAQGTHPRQLRRQGLPVLSQSDAVALANKGRA
jgi:hypothetical protein